MWHLRCLSLGGGGREIKGRIGDKKDEEMQMRLKEEIGRRKGIG